jgi:hypothetical protein
MKKYKVTLYPSVNDYITIVEADSIEEAINIAEDEANINTCFTATEDDVTEIEDE